MNIFKYIFRAFVFQLFLFIITMGIFIITERFLPPSVSDNLPLTIYAPFYLLVINLGNIKGESTMIEAPILAFVLGSFFYSIVLGFIYYFYKLSKNQI